MTSFGQFTYPEISAQAEALEEALSQLARQADWVQTYLKDNDADEVVFIGSGSSYYQALSMASTFRSWLGKSATAFPSSELFLFQRQALPPSRRYLVIGVSRSGESTEVVLALNAVKDLPNVRIASITCYEDSSMAQIAPALVSPKGKEKSTVMTKSFSSMTFLMQAAIAQASGRPELVSQLVEVAKADAQVVKAADAFIKPFVDGTELHKFIYLGMGTYYGIALEACLKIKEMSYVWTEAYGTLEFRHGPKSIVEPGSLVCLLLSEEARSYELKVAQEMKEYGATVLIVTARAGADTEFADSVFELGGAELSDDARTVLYLPLLQYLGFYTALKRQVDPDSPRNLTQVVKI
ncbi:glucosamine--fructose-6-phosphate aminotransferase (isomerizing) [Paenibacillus sp. UNCCL117]|uniref:SIS domain-containing protein n=1 Tax=unclassified Paenibacillus TaxID=185978 RepID=UPI0008867C56|nr:MULTISPECIES: SIS domain-containing protein [unclassified Paenibacillus]SDC67929.1 glucosamine--fructose-6-phosphate aminotransferase (isomerizing) [Paenibacillus sp. cl123]SFW23469.1 glucosamine--fructose-6-phosphate aminotransferase (isomerizing) [Paenibacillus sp. UNCCL117]